MKTTAKTLSLILSFVMLVTTVSALPAAVNANERTKTVNGVVYEYEIKKGKAIISSVNVPKKKSNKTITIPTKLGGKKVKAVDRFYSSAKNINVVIPDGIVRFGQDNGNEGHVDCIEVVSINSVKIGKNVSFVSNFYFSNAKKFIVNKKNKYYKAVNGVLYNKKKTKLIIYPARKTAKTFTVPKTVKTIGFAAFADAKIKTLNLNKVSKIGNEAFLGAKIGTLNVGKNLKSLYYYDLLDSNTLKAINVASGNKYYSSKNGVLFNKAKTKLLVYPRAKSDYGYNVPSGVKKISSMAFYNTKVCDVTLPTSVIYVESGAFDSAKLRTVTVLGSNTSFDESAIYSSTSNITIYAPSGSNAEAFANANNINFVVY